jgi:hypothetical protein
MENLYVRIPLPLGNYASETFGHFIEVVPGDPEVVRIVAVGKKEGNVVRIAGNEIEL